MRATIGTAFANGRMEVEVNRLFIPANGDGTQMAVITTPSGKALLVTAMSLKPVGCLERRGDKDGYERGLLCGLPVEDEQIKDSNFSKSTVFCVDHAMRRMAAAAYAAEGL